VIKEANYPTDARTDFGEIKEFSTAYLPGYLADKYDVSINDSIGRANTRCCQTCLDILRSSVTGYETCSLVSKNIVLERGTVHYGLLPVYLLYTQWNEKRFLFAVNGQTGKVVGNLPVSAGKAVGRFFMKFLISLLIGIPIVAAIVTFLFN
jgi:hypothetical protein